MYIGLLHEGVIDSALYENWQSFWFSFFSSMVIKIFMENSFYIEFSWIVL